jgi:hypothetical protein
MGLIKSPATSGGWRNSGAVQAAEGLPGGGGRCAGLCGANPLPGPGVPTPGRAGDPAERFHPFIQGAAM